MAHLLYRVAEFLVALLIFVGPYAAIVYLATRP